MKHKKSKNIDLHRLSFCIDKQSDMLIFQDVVFWFQKSLKIVILSNLIHSLNENLGIILKLTNIYNLQH